MENSLKSFPDHDQNLLYIPTDQEESLITLKKLIGKNHYHTTTLEYFLRKISIRWRRLSASVVQNSLISNKYSLFTVNDSNIKSVCQDLIKGTKIHSWRHLRSLEFQLNCRKITDKGITYFGPEICKKFSETRKVIFNLAGFSEITDRGLERFASSIGKNLTNIKQLVIILGSCSKITRTGIQAFALMINKNLTRLQHLDIEFVSIPPRVLPDEGVRAIASRICRYLLNLKRLLLKFDNCDHLTDRRLNEITSNLINRRIQLEQFSLGFTRSQHITDEGLRFCLLNLSMRFINARQLKLDFSECRNISDAGLGAIIAELFPLLCCLRELKLSFRGCQGITDQGLGHLGFGIRMQLLLLQRLHLHLDLCDNISDKGLEMLNSHLIHIKNLKELTLSFSFILSREDKVTDKAIKVLVCGISRHLINLERLELSFCNRRYITNDGLEYVANEISSNLMNLQHLTLRFSKYPQIEKGLTALRKKLESVPLFKLLAET